MDKHSARRHSLIEISSRHSRFGSAAVAGVKHIGEGLKSVAVAPPSATLISRSTGRNATGARRQIQMLFLIYYVVAIAVLILHFTGLLERHNLEWTVLAEAATVLPAAIYLPL